MDIHALLMTVVLGVSVRGRVSLAELRRVYGEVSGTVLAHSSFYDRFNEGLAALLKWLLDALMACSRDAPPRPPGALAFFEDVLCEDARSGGRAWGVEACQVLGHFPRHASASSSREP